MDIKGEVVAIKMHGEEKIFSVKNSEGVFSVKGNVNTPLSKGDTVSFINLSQKKGLIRKLYEFSENSLVFLHPEIYITESEMKLANFCELAPVISEIYGREKEEKNKELLFYRGIRGKLGEGTENPYAEIASRYPKELRGKFSYKQFQYDKKTGFLIYSALHFGRFPVVFSEDREKGEILALVSKSGKFVVINEGGGTMQEEVLEKNAAKRISEKRNSIVLSYLGKGIEDTFLRFSKDDCPLECPVYDFCKELENKEKSFGVFEKYLNQSLKKSLKYKKEYLKTLLTGSNPLRGTTKVKLKAKSEIDISYMFKFGIISNESCISKGEKAVVTEKLPLDRKTIVKIQHISYTEIGATGEGDIITPEILAPLPGKILTLKGAFDFVYSQNSSIEYFREKEPVIEAYDVKSFVKNDESQNEAVNKIVNVHGLFAVSGEHGTGKKFVLKTAMEELIKYGRSFLVIVQNRKKEIEKIILKDFGAFVGENGLINIYGINEEKLYAVTPRFDYTAILLDSPLGTLEIELLLGKSKNIIFFTPPNFIPFEERIPERNRVSLDTEHRFGEHILHFLQPILSQKLKSTDDTEISIQNLEKANKQFEQILLPSKFVQYVYVKGREFGANNKWNPDEAEFALEAVREFLKAGANPDQIGIIVPYERQEAYIKHLFAENKVPEVLVSRPDESEEKDIIFILFTDTRKISGDFSDDFLMKTALTRARSKLIIVGNRGVYKTSKLLSKIL